MLRNVFIYQNSWSAAVGDFLRHLEGDEVVGRGLAGDEGAAVRAEHEAAHEVVLLAPELQNRRAAPTVTSECPQKLSNFCQIFIKFQKNLHKFLHPR